MKSFSSKNRPFNPFLLCVIDALDIRQTVIPKNATIAELDALMIEHCKKNQFITFLTHSGSFAAKMNFYAEWC